MGQMHDRHRRMEEMIKALNKSIEKICLYDEGFFDEMISGGIRPIADVFGIDRVCVCRYIYTKDGKHPLLVYLWDKPDGARVIDESWAAVTDNEVVSNWMEALSKGGAINSRTCDMTAEEQAFLNKYGVKAVFIAPVFTDGKFWGIITLQNHTTDEHFAINKVEAHLLQSAVHILGIAIARGERERRMAHAPKKLKHREKLLNTIRQASEVLLTADDKNILEALTSGMEIVGRCLNVDRVQIWRNEMINGELHFVMRYEWLSEVGKKRIVVPIGINSPYSRHTRWHEMFLRGEYINSPISQLPPDEAAFLSYYEIKSIVMLPLFLNKEFIGYFSVDDCEYEVVFTDDEMEMLDSAGLMFASVFNKAMQADKIAEAEERIKLMLDSNPIGCYLCDRDFNIIDCNEACVKLFELRDKQEYKDKFFELSPEFQPDGQRSVEKVNMLLNKAFAEGYTVFEWVHRTYDGNTLPVEITFVRVKYEDDYVVSGYMRDLREHKKMMTEIEKGRLLLDTVNSVSVILFKSEINSFENDILKSMGMLAKVVKADRVYIWKNFIKNDSLHCTQIYEWSEGAEAQQGKDFAADTSYDIFAPETKVLLSQDKVINGIVKNMSAEAKRMFEPQGIISVILAPVFLQDQFWGFVGLDDCHKERIFTANEEKALRSAGLAMVSAITRFEQEIQIRDTNNRLEEALEQALSASRAKSNFLSTVSHEMRTPMNAIIGMTAIAKNEKLSEQKNHALDKVEKASRHLLGIINDVLDMSKIEANKLELRQADVDLKNLLQKVSSFVALRIDEKQQRFSINLDDNVPNFYIGDDQALSQVITNLLSNAVIYTPAEGEISLNISLIEEKDGVCELRFIVADNGIGISPDQQEKLFLMFEQADSGDRRKYGGTGLGLTISKRLVELMDGTILIESELGKGSKFIFTVKLLKAEEKPEITAGEAESPGGISTEQQNNKYLGKNLLIAEDIEINSEILIALLEGTGLAIDVAINGKEALEMVEANPDLYDFIFMDIQMPVMDGIEATRRIRALPAENCKKMPIVAMTAGVFKEDIKCCLEAGMDDHISKPIDINIVFEKLQKYLI